jgi:hypothetical protein
MSNLQTPSDPKWAKSCLDAYRKDEGLQTHSPVVGLYSDVRVKGRTLEDRNDEIIALAFSGKGCAEIGERYNLPPDYVGHIVRQARKDQPA